MAGSPPVVVRPGQLPRGSDARVAWLRDDDVHTAAGGTVDLPWSQKGARSQRLRLLGHTDRGWFLRSDDGGNTVAAWLARQGERHLVTAGSVSEGEVIRYQLAGDRSRFLVHRFDGDRNSALAVEDLDATLLDSQDLDGTAEVLSFSGAEAVVDLENTRRWDVDAGTAQGLGVDAAGADLDHDLLFVTDPATEESGPTSLETPGEPAWTAKMANVVVSPGGGRVLSRDERTGEQLTVRDVSTGDVLADFSVHYLFNDTPAFETPVWESNHSFVFLASVGGLGDKEVLVRCRLSGVCVRVSPITARDTLSLAQPRFFAR